MKKILFTLTAAALSLGWCSCSNNQAASTNAQSDKTSPASSSSPASADPSSGAPLFTATIDERLNEIAYIVPGLGDAGDRQFGPR